LQPGLEQAQGIAAHNYKNLSFDILIYAKPPVEGARVGGLFILSNGSI
jgi:hypothetical protein